MALLRSVRVLVLVNSSPTDEFPIQRGLRPNDHLYPLLCILAMEGFHVALVWEHLVYAFTRIHIGQLDIFHLYYANDVMLLAPWSLENAN